MTKEPMQDCVNPRDFDWSLHKRAFTSSQQAAYWSTLRVSSSTYSDHTLKIDALGDDHQTLFVRIVLAHIQQLADAGHVDERLKRARECSGHMLQRIETSKSVIGMMKVENARRMDASSSTASPPKGGGKSQDGGFKGGMGGKQGNGRASQARQGRARNEQAGQGTGTGNGRQGKAMEGN